MRNIFLIILLTFNISLWADTKSSNKQKANAIATQQERQRFISTCQNILNINHDFVFQSNNLFIYSNEVQESIPDKPPVVSPEPTLNIINEVVILKEVGQSLKPDGRVLVKGEYRLCIRGSRTLKAGDHLNANYNGKFFKITIKEITKDSFTLSLNHYSLSFNY